MGKDPIEELKPIVQYVTGFCAKDCAEPKGDVMIQFGAGKVDFAGVFQVLKSAGFNGPIMVECCAVGETPEATGANARANREFLEKVLAGIRRPPGFRIRVQGFATAPFSAIGREVRSVSRRRPAGAPSRGPRRAARAA